MTSAPVTANVVVIGAGPVGLAVAARLGRSPAPGLRVRVLEAAPPALWDAARIDLRVYALSRASQRMLDEAGVWRTIAAQRASPYRRMRVWQGGTPDGFPSIDFDAADIGEPDLGHIVEDGLIRDALRRRIAELDAVDLTSGVEIETLSVTSAGALLGLEGGESLRADLLVAADGAASSIRARLDIPTLKRDYGQHALVTHVATEAPHRETAYQRFLPGGPLAFLPLSDGRSSVVWSLPSERAAVLAEADEDAFLAELQQASGGVLGRLGPAAGRARFPLQLLHARNYCRPHVALVGDAAHCVHPLAGQGMNLGLLDAACLADEIERARRQGGHVGDARVLRRYERRRKGRNLEMMLALDALDRLFRLPRWADPLRAFGMHAVDCAMPAKRALMRQALRPAREQNGR